jgi:hypothetical protein
MQLQDFSLGGKINHRRVDCVKQNGIDIHVFYKEELNIEG